VTVIGPSNLDVTDLGPNPMTSADVMSTIAPEAGEPSDVAFFLRVVAPAYEHSYPPDVYGPPATPVLSTLTPNSIVIDTPTEVQVTGTGFTHNSHVFVDGVEQITTYVSPTVLHYTAEADTPGTQDVTVVTEHAGGDLTSNMVVLTVTATAVELATEEQSTSPPAAPGDVPPPEAPPDSGGGVTGGRRPRNGNGGKRQT